MPTRQELAVMYELRDDVVGLEELLVNVRGTNTLRTDQLQEARSQVGKADDAFRAGLDAMQQERPSISLTERAADVRVVLVMKDELRQALGRLATVLIAIKADAQS